MKTRKSKDRILMAEGEVTPELFAQMVEDHDPTYLWSDNQRHIEIERKREDQIIKARLIIGDQHAVPIWNQIIRKKVVPSFVDQYLWSRQEANHA
jgi:hypothetical protein